MLNTSNICNNTYSRAVPPKELIIQKVGFKFEQQKKK